MKLQYHGVIIMNDVKDIIIVGAGLAGLSALLYAKRAGYSVSVIEKDVYYGSQIAKTSVVDNYPGIPDIMGADLLDAFKKHAIYNKDDIISDQVTGFEYNDNLWSVFTKTSSYKARTIIYAAGAHHRNLNVPGEKEYTGKGVSYCATCDGAFFRDKNIAVCGGGNTAAQDVLYMTDIAKKIYLIHRRGSFRFSDKILDKIKQAGNVNIITNDTVKSINGDKTVSEIVLNSGKTIEVSGVFIAVGMNPDTAILKDMNILDDSGYIIADETCKTCLKGFFAAGDVRTKPLRQAVTAASDGAVCVESVTEYLKY